jgi:four helix bundle protein
MCGRLPRFDMARLLRGQVLRSGTSVGAQYREACRARSKLESALQELDETAYWLELITESGIYAKLEVQELLAETDELIRIFVTIIRRRKEES